MAGDRIQPTDKSAHGRTIPDDDLRVIEKHKECGIIPPGCPKPQMFYDAQILPQGPRNIVDYHFEDREGCG